MPNISTIDSVSIIKEAFVFACPKNATDVDSFSFDAPIEQLGIESIAALEMVGYIEEKLNIQFEDSEMASINTFNRIVELIHKHTALAIEE
jgi:acyl carrier protein